MITFFLSQGALELNFELVSLSEWLADLKIMQNIFGQDIKISIHPHNAFFQLEKEEISFIQLNNNKFPI